MQGEEVHLAGCTMDFILPPETYHASGDIYFNGGCFQYLVYIHRVLKQNICKVLGSRRLLEKVCESLRDLDSPTRCRLWH